MDCKQQVSATIKSCYFYLRKISSIRQYLTQAATETLIHAFISSRLDQCNSLYAKLPKYTIKRLHKSKTLLLALRFDNHDALTPPLFSDNFIGSLYTLELTSK